MKKNEILSLIKVLKLTEYQTEKLVMDILDILSLNETTISTYPESCPFS